VPRPNTNIIKKLIKFRTFESIIGMNNSSIISLTKMERFVYNYPD